LQEVYLFNGSICKPSPLLYGKCFFVIITYYLDVPDVQLVIAYKQEYPNLMARELFKTLFTSQEIKTHCATTKGKSEKPPINQQIYGRIKGK
jgi:hypothetical protein